MISFPLELFCLIIQRVDSKNDLTALARASHNLHFEAERQLYREIKLWVNSRMDYSIHLAILNALASSSRRASYVHSISYEPTGTQVDVKLSCALKGCTNLKRLTVFENETRISPLSCLEGVSVELESIDLSTRMELSDRDVNLLGRQGRLKELEWTHVDAPRNQSATLTGYFPKLKALTLWGSINARYVLLQQTVTHLSLDSNYDHYELEDVFESIQSLKTWRPLSLRSARLFPNLKYLWTRVRF